MTPAERARQIDREEFAANSRAALERALAHSRACREREAEKYRAWLLADSESRVPASVAKHQRVGTANGNRAIAASAALYSAFGRKCSVSEWAKETGISVAVIHGRLTNGWTVERALTEPVLSGKERGVLKRNRRMIRRIVECFQAISGQMGTSQFPAVDRAYRGT